MKQTDRQTERQGHREINFTSNKKYIICRIWHFYAYSRALQNLMIVYISSISEVTVQSIWLALMLWRCLAWYFFLNYLFHEVILNRDNFVDLTIYFHNSIIGGVTSQWLVRSVGGSVIISKKRCQVFTSFRTQYPFNLSFDLEGQLGQLDWWLCGWSVLGWLFVLWYLKRQLNQNFDFFFDGYEH